MVDVPFLDIAGQRFQGLGFPQRRQGQAVEDLGLASRKEGAAVRPGQETHFAADRTDFVESAAVGTDLVHRDDMTEDPFDELLHHMGDIDLVVRIQFRKVLHDLCLGFFHHLVAVEFVRIHQSVMDLRFAVGIDFPGQIFGRRIDFELHLGLADFGLDLFLESHEFLDLLMGKENGVEHGGLGNFLRTGFDHQDGFLCAGHSKIELAHFGLGHRRVDDEFAVDQTDADAGDRSFKGDIRNGQGAGGTDHRRDIRSIVRIDGNGRRHDLHIIMVSVRKHGADRTVDQPGRQDGRFGRASLPAQETAGDPPGSVHLFFKINSQREKIHAFTGCIRPGCGHDHSGLAVTDQNSAIGLFGNLTGFDGKGPAPQLRTKCMHPLHPPYLSFAECTAQLYYKTNFLV